MLFLALAIELRVFKLPTVPSSVDPELPEKIDQLIGALNNWAVAAVALLALVTGEIFALMTVAYGHPTWKLGQGIVLGACFAGVLMIGYASLSAAQTNGGGPQA